MGFAALAGYIANAAYQGSTVAINAAEAHADLGMAVCAAAMGVLFLAIPAVFSREEMRRTFA